MHRISNFTWQDWYVKGESNLRWQVKVILWHLYLKITSFPSSFSDIHKIKIACWSTETYLEKFPLYWTDRISWERSLLCIMRIHLMLDLWFQRDGLLATIQLYKLIMKWMFWDLGMPSYVVTLPLRKLYARTYFCIFSGYNIPLFAYKSIYWPKMVRTS